MLHALYNSELGAYTGEYKNQTPRNALLDNQELKIDGSPLRWAIVSCDGCGSYSDVWVLEIDGEPTALCGGCR